MAFQLVEKALLLAILITFKLSAIFSAIYMLLLSE